MSDQITTAIADLIDTGRRKINAVAEERTRRETEHACERQSAVAAIATECWTAIGNILPDDVLYYVGLCSEIDPAGWSDAIYRLEVPNCAAITITLKREQTGVVDGRYTYGYRPSKNYKNGVERGVYCVSHIDLIARTDDGEVIGYTVGEDGHHSYTDDLSVALALAAEQGAKMDTLSAMAEIKTAEVQARAIARQAALDKQQIAAEDRRLSLITKILDDDLALRLVELFLAIQSDRENWVSTVQDAAAHADEVAERYEHRLAEKQREADRAIRSVKDDADRAQREADDLQSQLDSIKRQAQFA